MVRFRYKKVVFSISVGLYVDYTDENRWNKNGLKCAEICVFYFYVRNIITHEKRGVKQANRRVETRRLRPQICAVTPRRQPMANSFSRYQNFPDSRDFLFFTNFGKIHIFINCPHTGYTGVYMGEYFRCFFLQ